MMQSNAATVAEYLTELPSDRRTAIELVRETILKNLDGSFEEAMQSGMISYQVPLKVYPDTYNKQPLMYAALASQKNHMAVYLMSIYGSEEARAKFESDYKATGKKYNVGKSCVRFRRLDDLPLAIIGEAIATESAESYAAMVKALKKPQ